MTFTKVTIFQHEIRFSPKFGRHRWHTQRGIEIVGPSHHVHPIPLHISQVFLYINGRKWHYKILIDFPILSPHAAWWPERIQKENTKWLMLKPDHKLFCSKYTQYVRRHCSEFVKFLKRMNTFPERIAQYPMQ